MTKKIPDWRADTRDVYLRWAITINAMHVAKTRYKEHPELGLQTKTLRANREGAAREVVLETWTAGDASRNYELATPILASYALVDLFGLVEEIIFEFYLIFINHNPMGILPGSEFREIRKLFHNRETSAHAKEKWEAAWAERLGKWRRNRLYDGLHRVFAALISDAKLVAPSHYKHTKTSDWVAVIEAVSEARNLITHGEGTVSQRLDDLTKKLKTNVFVFEAGQPLEISLEHLMFVESFLDGLLNALSISLLERAYGPMPAPEEKGE